VDVQRRWKQSMLFALALVLVYPVDCVMLERPSPATLVLRVAWGLEILLYMCVWQRLGARWEGWVNGVHVVLLSAFFMGLVFLTGGPESPYLSMTPSVPLMIALVFTETTLPALLTGLVCMAGTLLIWLTHGRVVNAVAWSTLVGVSSFFGMYSAMRFRAAQAAGAEALLERTRREALEKLAVADRHRAHAEKLATVGRLAANVMHELNNPLAFVRANLHFLRTEVLAQSLPEPARDELKEVFDETHLGVERIRQIVADLRSYSRMDGEDSSQCALADVVTDAAMLAGVRLKNVARLKVEVPRELPEVFASPRRLAQVLLNLIVNAGDALEEARVRDGEVRVTGREENGRVFLEVEDNGPGFPPAVLARLFDAFFTTKGPEKGTGLGLCLSREMVEHFGGTLQAENRPEGGARLRLSLPVHPPA
jgi:signal transduction histidine kinase